jgi:outer membrane protein assembly factor BamB
MKQAFKTIIILYLLSSAAFAQNGLMWDFSAEGGIYSSPVVDENTLYIGSNDSCLYALDKQSGKLKWKFKTAGKIKSRPLLHKNFVIFNSTDGFVYSLNKSNAQEQWKFKTKGEKTYDIWDYYLSAPVYAYNKVFVGSGDGNIYAINPNNGALVWKYQTEGIVHATPLIHNEMLYVGSFDGNMYALKVSNGDLVWKFKTVGDAYFPKGEIQRAAALYENTLIFGSRDFNVYAINAETGRGMWNMKEKGSWVIATPLIIDDMVYFGTSDSHRFCGLTAKRGHVKYDFPLNMRVYGQAVEFDNDLYFGCFNGKLYRINKQNDTLEEVFQTHGSKKNYYTVYNAEDKFKEGFISSAKDAETVENKILDLGSILSTPATEEGIIYFGDAKGYIYAYKL